MEAAREIETSAATNMVWSLRRTLWRVSSAFVGYTILFDLDGTLTDPKEGISKSLCHALERMGQKSPDPKSLDWCIGPPIQDSIWLILGTDEEEPNEQCLGYFRERYGKEGLLENKVYEGIPEALTALKKAGHKLVVATSKPEIFTEQILKHFKLAKHFSAVYGSELDGERSKKADLIAHVLKAEGISASEALMIGDREHDVIGAKVNKVKSLGVLWGYGTREELTKAGVSAVCEKVEDLVEAVSALADGS